MKWFLFCVFSLFAVSCASLKGAEEGGGHAKTPEPRIPAGLVHPQPPSPEVFACLDLKLLQGCSFKNKKNQMVTGVCQKAPPEEVQELICNPKKTNRAARR